MELRVFAPGGRLVIVTDGAGQGLRWHAEVTASSSGVGAAKATRSPRTLDSWITSSVIM